MNHKRFCGKFLKWVGRIILSLVAIVCLLMVIIYLPPVQQWLKDKVTDYLSEETGLKIDIGHIKLSPMLDLVVKDMSAVSGKDTVVATRELMLDAKVLPLLTGKVELNNFELREAKLNTLDLISDTHIEGKFRLLAIDMPAVLHLTEKQVDMNRIRLKGADVRVLLSDTAAIDTTPSEPTNWRIALGELKVEQTNFYLQMPGDSMRVGGHLAGLNLKKADINLEKNAYKVGELDLNANNISYNLPYETPTEGFDANHLLIAQLNVKAHDIKYDKSGLDLVLKHLALKEKSGLEVSDARGTLHYDSTLVKLDNGLLETPHSRVKASAKVGSNGLLEVKVKGNVGKEDIAIFGGDDLGDMIAQMPDEPLQINLRAEGTTRDLDIDYILLTLPNRAEVRISGRLREIADEMRRNGELHYTMALHNADFLGGLLPKDLQSQIRIPAGTRIGGDIALNGSQFIFNKNTIYCGKGSLSFNGRFSASNMSYDGRLTAHQFPLQLFLPGMGLSPLTGDFSARGKGMDFLTNGTTMVLNSQITNFSYADIPLDNLSLQANLNGTNAEGSLHVDNSWLKTALSLSAMQQNGIISGTIDGAIESLHLNQLTNSNDSAKIADDLQLMADIHIKGFYESKAQKVGVGGNIDRLTAMNSRVGYPANDISFGVGTSPDSTHVFLNSGDMTLLARSDNPLEAIIDGLSNFANEFIDKFSAAQLDQNTLRQLLPDLHLRLQAGFSNPLQQIMALKGYTFDSIAINLDADRTNGLNATANVDNFKTGNMLFETMRLKIAQNSDALQLNASVKNENKKNPNRFTATLDGNIVKDGFSALANFKDAQGREGLHIGTRAKFDGIGGMSFTLIPEISTLAYRKFKVNQDNFLSVDSAGFITADIDLLADDNTNLKLLSVISDSINQDITLSIANLNLHDISSVVPYMPSVSGWIDGDIHLVKTPESFTAVGQLQSRKLEYEGLYVGDIGTELFYMPEQDGHYVVAQILTNDKEVAVLDGHYYDQQDGVLDATLSLNKFPVAMINAMLSNDGTIALSGLANGEISVKGAIDNLYLNGTLKPDSIHAYSELYGFDLAIANKEIGIENGKIRFDNTQFFSKQSENPLNIDGTVDLGNFSNIVYDLSIKAKNFELINAPKTKKALVYGKVYVDMDATLKGKEGFMVMRGGLNVLGSTDVTYIMRDSPLQVDDQFSGLVEFVDFNEDETATEEASTMSGLFITMNIKVAEATHLHCELSEDGKSYVDCRGGGDLTMTMFPSGDMSMNGRFNIKGGEMKYTLPFIPLKTFTFADGNYILFTGDIGNPTLNITATERTKAAVTGENESSRMVVFDVGVKISKQLSNMGIEFLIDAPEDTEVQSELAAMGAEAKNKAAITMLATGLYMSADNKTGFRANNALNSFLETEIQNIAGSALKTIDVSIGVEGTTTATGDTQTDYTFQFSKKFWNDRVSFVIGGKVSTGADDNTSSTQSFIDNISLEYRLNKFGTRYIQLFYDNDTRDPLEGSYSSAGAGYIWRSKTDNFGDLLLFRRKKNK